MFILVLQQCHKENEDKWKRLSRQIADVILPMIAKQQVGKCSFTWELRLSYLYWKIVEDDNIYGMCRECLVFNN